MFRSKKFKEAVIEEQLATMLNIYSERIEKVRKEIQKIIQEFKSKKISYADAKKLLQNYMKELLKIKSDLKKQKPKNPDLKAQKESLIAKVNELVKIIEKF